ncbi:MAG TPA: OsmC family protein [Gemmatimonadales bacterium]|jgi:osmotically inducible protein OsmC|nr:OsmC family protein [Gemmatimonadales bacterium]
MATSNAVAIWEGKLKDGKGSFKAQSGVFSGSFSFGTRFEGKKGSNPEELIAAAHAGCYSMALSSALEKAGHPATRIETRAAVSLEMVDGAPKITKSVLEVRGKVDGIDQAAFEQAAEGAKKNCPVSKALQGNVAITMDAKLV